MLPQAYRDLLEVAEDAGRPLRAAQIAAGTPASWTRSSSRSCAPRWAPALLHRLGFSPQVPACRCDSFEKILENYPLSFAEAGID